MRKLVAIIGGVALVLMTGCSTITATKPLEGVAVSKVIDQIKQDLANSSAADLKVGDGTVNACGEDKGKPLVLMRGDPPTVTMKLTTAKAIDATADVGVAKLPVIAVLFSADASYEYKRQETSEQDITFSIVRPTKKNGDPVIVAVPPEKYSKLGQLINETELGVLATNHTLEPCLQLTKVSVNILVDVTRTVGINGSVGFALLYSVSSKNMHADELKNQVQIDLSYDKNTPAFFQDQ